MAVTAVAQLGVMISGTIFLLDGPAGPVIERIAQAQIAAITDAELASFSRLPGDGTRAAIEPHGVVVSLAKAVRSFGEHRDGNYAAHSGRGEEHDNITMLAGVAI